MANGWGGSRANSGRQAKRIKFAGQVGKMDKKLAAHVDRAATNVIKLADGGFQRTTEVWKLACAMTKTEYVQGTTANGGDMLMKKEVPLFPNAKKDEMVLVERRVETLAPDLAANKYLIDRIAGTPSTMEEPEEKKAGAKVDDEARKAAEVKIKEWRQTSVEELDSIRNPFTGQNLSESESMNEASSNLDSTTTDEF